MIKLELSPLAPPPVRAGSKPPGYGDGVPEVFLCVCLNFENTIVITVNCGAILGIKMVSFQSQMPVLLRPSALALVLEPFSRVLSE